MIKTINAKKLKYLAISLLITLGGGFLSSVLAGDTSDFYNSIQKPPFAPPGIVFPIVWAILYVFMGYAAYRVYYYGKDDELKSNALKNYAINLVLNFLWSVVFFRFELLGLAFVWVIVLSISTIITTVKFEKIDSLSGFLFTVYALWTVFATVLTGAVWWLNR